MARHIDFIGLFLHADIVVKIVLVGLLLASVTGWVIIVATAARMHRLDSLCDAFEHHFWKAGDLARLKFNSGESDVPLVRIASAAMRELGHVRASPTQDFAGLRDRLAGAMNRVIGLETEAVGRPLNFLATVGSVAPFVGLFGTVWGIINSFFQIGQHHNSSLAVVAPGISEALFATAVGLIAAIPAVIAYNHFAFRVGSFEARLQRFADLLHARISRELEQQ